MSRRTRPVRALLALAAATLASLAAAPAVLAATVAVESDGTVHYSSTALNVENYIYVQGSSSSVYIYDDYQNEPIVAGDGCANDGTYYVYCESETPFSGIRVDLGDGDDTVYSYVALPTTLNGEDDEDRLYFFPSESDEPAAAAGTLNGGDDEDQIASGAGDQTLNGGPGGDELDGGDGNDTLNGDSGGDRLMDRAGDSAFEGGTPTPNGNDTLNGGPDGDALCDGEGDDTLNGGDGNDDLNSTDYYSSCGNYYGWVRAEGSDTMSRGSNVINGGAGDDNLYGGLDNDTLNGEGGQDEFYGSPGNDTYSGGEERDEFRENFATFHVDNETSVRNDGDSGADVYNGGSGRDWIGMYDRDLNDDDHDDDISISLDDQANDGAAGENDNVKSDIEEVSTGSGSDTLIGSAASNSLYAGAGNDTVSGGGGADEIYGGDDRDVLAGGAGNDDVFGDDQYDDDNRFASSDAGSRNHTGSPGPDLIAGNDGNDNLFGGQGDDTIAGGDGNDGLYGESGSDDMSGGVGADFVDYSYTSSRVTVTLNDAADDGPIGENDNARSDIEDVVGGFGNDDITGNGLANTLSGGSGNDTLNSRDSVQDLVVCGPGLDTALVDSLDVVEDEGDDRCERVEVVQIAGPPAVQRVAPKSLSSKVSPKRDRKFPFRFRVSGKLTLPAGVSKTDGCKGKVAVVYKYRDSTISRRLATLSKNCTYSSRVKFSVKRRLKGAKRLNVVVRFQGNTRLLAKSASRKVARIRK